MSKGRLDVYDRTSGLLFANHPFAPILLLIVTLALATLVNQSQQQPLQMDPTHRNGLEDSPSQPVQVSYTPGAITDLHQSGQLQARSGWQPISAPYAGLGFTDHPVTFPVELRNDLHTPLDQWVSVPAPYIDRIRAVRLDPKQDSLIPMRTQGSQRTVANRRIPLPSFHWPVTIPPESALTLFFEVTDSGPTVFPVSVLNGDTLIQNSVSRATVNGTLLGLSLFLLAINLFLVLRFRTVMLAWLTVFTASVIHIQLVLNGFGAWSFWRDIPSLNAVITTSMLVTVIAFTQHTIAALNPIPFFRNGLNALSLSAFALLLLDLAGASIPIQALTIILGLLGCIVALVVALLHFHRSLYARYFTLAVLILMSGLIASALRTIAILPINVVTDAAFPLGTILSAIVLLAAAVHFFWREQRLRRTAASDRVREQEYRIAVQHQLETSLRTHKVTGYPNRAALEACLTGQHPTEFQVVVLRLARFHEIESCGWPSTDRALCP